MDEAANPDDTQPADEAAARLHRVLMAQEDGLDAPAGEPASVDGALALARELHELGELLAEAEGSEAPQRWGRFQILRPLGRGGLSEVYLALDEKLGRRVAVKRLRPHAALDDQRRSWLVREGQSLARIQHPGVVGVLDLDTSQDDPLLVMEYVEGAPLSSVLAQLGGAPSDDPHVRAAAAVLEPVAARVDLARKLAFALAHCHAEGVLHRDIKPSNVVIDLEFQPRLIDFGLAHLDGASDVAAQAHLTEQLVGTPAYFAPEQIDATRIGADPRSEQFAFGALLYELLSGVQPFARPTRQATLQAVANAEFAALRGVAPHVAPELEWIVQRCLERDMHERFDDMGALARDLDAFLNYRAVSAAPPSLLKQTVRALRRNAARVAALGAAVALATLTLGAKYAHEVNAARRERAQTVAGVRSTLGACSQPDDFQAALYRLADVAGEVQAEAGTVRALLAGSLTEQLEQAHAELAEALLAKLSLERDEGRSKLREFQLSRWRGALAALARACPADLRVREQIERERVWGPVDAALEHRLQRWVPSVGGQAPRLVTTQWLSDPGPGRYRWSAFERASGALLAEREFTLRSDCAPVHLTLDPQAALEWDQRLVELRANNGAGSPAPVRVGFGLVTWADFERAFPEASSPEHPDNHWRACRDSRRSLGAEFGEPRAAAVVSYPDAELFAARVGARLPTFEELDAAFEQRALAAPDPLIDYEWLCEPGRISDNAAIRKHRDPQSSRSEISSSLEFWGRTTGSAIGFRLARSER